jgi:hypothetical protein
MGENKRNCQICQKEHLVMLRYPNAVCMDCRQRYQLMTSSRENAVPIKFYNEDVWGGFYSMINGERGQIHECCLNGVRCYAQEARFGGIVISVVA